MSLKRTGAACLILGCLLGAAAVVPFVTRTNAADSAPAGDAARVVAATPELAGRHIVRIAGCNDCHTPGFERQGEQVSGNQWLIGVPVGFNGPWGTSYASNLRTKVQALNEEQWTTFLKNYTGRPPMPWASVHAMSDEDRRNLYRYIRSLGPSDNAVPDALEPGVTPKTPYVVFAPVMPAAPR